METELAKRKPMRLKCFDYSQTGAYFVTICTSDRQCILSDIIRSHPIVNNKSQVGEGLAPPAYTIKLKPCGKISEEQLYLLNKRYPEVSVSDYVIMPDHIHIIFHIQKSSGGASPSPTLSNVVCTFKSLTSRIYKQRFEIDKVFQRSFAEHIIRDRDDYETRRKYIYENPMRWYQNHPSDTKN